MYSRILLAYDGSVEGRTALREGAVLARQCGAQVFLLSVLADMGPLLLSEVIVPAVPPKLTPVASDRFSPVIVTEVPPACGPLVGVSPLTTGAGVV